MKKGKLLTICVCVYNIDPYLDECLRSLIFERGLDQLEVVVIDDGSTDESGKIADRYEEAYSDTVQVIHKENGGAGSAVKEGIRRATGKYFKILDGDDIADTENLALLLDALKKTDVDLVLTDWMEFNDGGHDLNKYSPSPDGISAFQKYDLRENIESVKRAKTNVLAIVVKTDVLRSLPEIKSDRYYVDLEFNVRALTGAKDFCYMPYAVTKYRDMRQGQSTTGPSLLKHYKDHYSVVLNILDYYKEIEDGAWFLSQYNRVFSIVANDSYNILLAAKGAFKEFKDFDKKVRRYVAWRRLGTSVRLVLKSHFLLYPMMHIRARRLMEKKV